MRKCIITTNIRTTRTDEELQELWEKSLLQTAIDPSIDSIGRRDFYSINRTYWEKKKVVGLFHQWGVDSEESDNGLVIIQ